MRTQEDHRILNTILFWLCLLEMVSKWSQESSFSKNKKVVGWVEEFISLVVFMSTFINGSMNAWIHVRMSVCVCVCLGLLSLGISFLMDNLEDIVFIERGAYAFNLVLNVVGAEEKNVSSYCCLPHWFICPNNHPSLQYHTLFFLTTSYTQPFSTIIIFKFSMYLFPIYLFINLSLFINLFYIHLCKSHPPFSSVSILCFCCQCFTSPPPPCNSFCSVTEGALTSLCLYFYFSIAYTHLRNNLLQLI